MDNNSSPQQFNQLPTFDPSALSAVVGQGQGIVLREQGIGKTIAHSFDTQELERIPEQGRSKIKPPLEDHVGVQHRSAVSMPDQQFPTTRVVR